MMRSCLRGVVVALGLAWSAVAAAEEPTLQLTFREAVTRALRHNLSLQQERLAPALSGAAEEVARASFQPELFASVNSSRSPSQVTMQRADQVSTTNTLLTGEVGLRQSFSTGTSAELGLSSQALFGGGVVDPAYQTGVTLTARQSLLQGVSREANQVAVTTARLERRGARQRLQRKAEEVAAATLKAYFDLHAALAQDAIQGLAITTSETTLRETRILIAAGKVAPSEEVSARYALQTQQRAKLQTEQAVADARDRLARLMGLVTPRSLATPPLVTTETAPTLPAASELAGLHRSALESRGDYLAALSQVKVKEAKARASRHVVLPKLDLVGSVFATGLSGSSSMDGSLLSPGYWPSYEMDSVGWSAGLVLGVPLGNGKAKGELQAAELELKQARTAVAALEQEVSEELNRTWRALHLAQRQLELTKAAAEVARIKLRNEEALYKAGKSTAHILAAVQAEALKEGLAQAQAAADLNKAVVTLYATAGDLLPRLRLSR